MRGPSTWSVLRTRCSTPASRRSPTPPPGRSSAARSSSSPASEGDRPRVALVADGLGGMHGVTHTIQQIRDRGVPGYDVEVIGTDADVDRRLSAVADIDIPFYRGPRDRGPDPARPGRGAGRGSLRPDPPLLAGAGGSRRLAAGPGARAAGGRQLPHRAGRLRRPALGDGAPGGDGRRGAGRLLRRLRRRPLAQPGQRRAAGAARDRAGRGSAAGTAASTWSASTRGCGSRAPSPVRSTSSTPAG